MKQVMMVKFDSPKWRKVDEYKVANPFVDVGFRQVKDVVDLRVFDLLNISRINNNRAEEMLLCIYHLLQPDSRIDEGIYNDEIDQYFSYREWKKKHQPLSGVTVREILATEDLNEDALLRIFDGVTAAFYKSDEYNSREYRYSNLSELRKAMKHMQQLVESIKERGVITPATVRQKEDGRYELVSGHRRKRASELAGFETLRCEVVDLNRDEATILMVESNFQRSQILPSEKAFAYKMRLEAMKRQAGRPTKNNLVPVGQNYSREELAAQSGESQTQIQRYIRLTNLVPELLEFVDEGRIKMRPAVELSYLDEDCQRDVVDEIDLNDATPSHDQTIRMRKLFNEGNLTTEAIHAVMSEEKPNQKEKIVLRGDRVRQLIPKNIPVSQTEDFVCKALEHYNKFLRNRAERDSR